MGFDLDKILAEEAKAEKTKPFDFTFDGEKYQLPPVLDVRALAAIEQGSLDGILSSLLGNDQWEQIKNSSKLLTVSAMKQLIDSYYEHVGGTDLGKSLVSTDSSVSTVKPSKRTSNGSTTRRSRS